MSERDNYNDFTEKELNGGVPLLEQEIEKLVKEIEEKKNKIERLKTYEKSKYFKTNNERKERIVLLNKEIEDLYKINGSDISISDKQKNLKLIEEKYQELNKINNVKENFDKNKKLLKDLKNEYYEAPESAREDIKISMINELIKSGCTKNQALLIAKNTINSIPSKIKTRDKTWKEALDNKFDLSEAPVTLDPEENYEDEVDLSNVSVTQDPKENIDDVVLPDAPVTQDPEGNYDDKVDPKVPVTLDPEEQRNLNGYTVNDPSFKVVTDLEPGEKREKKVGNFKQASEKLKAIIKNKKTKQISGIIAVIGVVGLVVGGMAVAGPAMLGAVAGAGAIELENKVKGK